jgi:hypothetical protein
VKTMAEVEMDLHLLIKDLHLPLSPANRELLVKTLTAAGFGPVNAAALTEALEKAEVIHVHHHDIEHHARSYNEGYDAAITQGLADDPTLADDWFQGKLRAAAAEALRDAGEAIEARRPEMGRDINITQYREGRNDAFALASDICNARAELIEADQ